MSRIDSEPSHQDHNNADELETIYPFPTHLTRTDKVLITALVLTLAVLTQANNPNLRREWKKVQHDLGLYQPAPKPTIGIIDPAPNHFPPKTPYGTNK